jgi:hypothetical protein
LEETEEGGGGGEGEGGGGGGGVRHSMFKTRTHQVRWWEKEALEQQLKIVGHPWANKMQTQ